MTVLNTYVENELNGFLAPTLLLLLLVLSIFLFKDDITRFLEHHTIGAALYSYMKYVWILPFVLSIIFALVCMSKSSSEHIYVEATIKDAYPIGPLYEKYEIVEKRGDIWVLEQRETWEENVVTSEPETEQGK